MSVANCPGCGAPVEFTIGSSIVLICPHCRAAVARTDRDLESLGKVSALIETGSPLRVGLPGRYQNIGFRLVGRVQLRHDSGAIWDEWYAAFDDGRWGWLDEADGYYCVTFETRDADAPSAASLQIGDQVAAVDAMKVFEIGDAEVVSGEGEMPWRAAPGSRYRYADLSGPGGRFATIEDTSKGSVVFKGRETSLSGLGITPQVESRAGRVAVKKISCTQCGGSLNLVAPDRAERVACMHCGALHDIKPGSVLEFLAKQKKLKIKPLLPLGSEGTIDGVTYLVAGFMQRIVKSESPPWSWTEYLLFNRETGFRYLTEDDGHWSVEQPVLPGDITDSLPDGAPKFLFWKNKRFRLFETSTPSVKVVLGEFPWKVEIGETVPTSDYIAPPEGMSKEIFSAARGTEANYSIARYMPVEEVETAFGVEKLPRPSTIGAMQPNPAPSLLNPWAMAMGLLFIIAVIVAIARREHVLLTQSFDLAALESPAGTAGGSLRKFSTRPFHLTGKRHVGVRGFSNLPANTHVELVGEIDHVDSNLSDDVALWMEYASGSDDEGPWTEDARADVAHLSALPGGDYRLDFQAQYNGSPPPTVHLEVFEGGFRWSHFLLAAIAISIIPAIAEFFRIRFEWSRWSDSDYTPFPTSEEDDDDD